MKNIKRFILEYVLYLVVLIPFFGFSQWTYVKSPTIRIEIADDIITGNDNIYINFNNIKQLYISADTGKSWVIRKAPFSIYFTAYFNNMLVALDNQVVYTSSNEGISWKKFNFKNSISYYTPIGDKLYFVSGDSLYVSSGDLSTYNVLGFIGKKSRLLAINDDMYIASNYNKGVFISNDACKTWSITTLGSGITYYDCIVKDSMIFILSDNGLYISYDKGQSFSYSANGIPSYTYIKSVQLSGNKLYAAYYDSSNPATGGVFISNDYGLSWSAANKGLESLDIKKIAVSGSNILCWSETKGLYISYDAGKLWNHIYMDIEIPGSIDKIATCRDKIFTEQYVYSLKTGEWKDSKQELKSKEIIELIATDSSVYANAESCGVFYYNFDSDKWEARSNGLDYPNVRAIAAAGKYAFCSLYYEWADDGGLYMSDNYGLEWKRILGGSYYNFSNIAAEGTNIYAVFGDGTYEKRKMYYSNDLGTTWTIQDSVFVENSINKLKIKKDLLFAWTDKGIFISKDKAKTWNSTLFNSDYYLRDYNIDDSLLFSCSYNNFYYSKYPYQKEKVANKSMGESFNCITVYDDMVYAGTSGGLYKRKISDFKPYYPKLLHKGATSFCYGDSVLLYYNNYEQKLYWHYKNNQNIVNYLYLNDTLLYAKKAGVYYIASSYDWDKNKSNVFDSIRINVTTPPDTAIIAEPSSNLCQGQTITLFAKAGPIVSYQWKKDNSIIPGATGSMLKVDEPAVYSLFIQDTCGNLNNYSINISILKDTVLKPVIDSDSLINLCSGDSVKLKIKYKIDTLLFDGFESGDFSKYDWKVTAEKNISILILLVTAVNIL
ncbi:MAG: hypothetical protein KA792_10285 [Bacteroidales bacterium]|nr:hypothetical protein [Bacteroidales bacterium]